MTLPAVRLINGHPDDNNAEASALAALDTPTRYGAEWPRETAIRYLHAVTNRDRAHAKVTAPPSEKDLSQLLRGSATPIELAVFEAFLGTERVASEIVSYLERGGSDGALIEVLSVLRERLPVSDRSRIDARLRILTKMTPLPAVETMLSPAKRASKPPPASANVKSVPPKKPAAKKKGARKSKP